MSRKIKVGVVGFGNMGSAIAAKFAANGHELYVFDKDKNRLQEANCANFVTGLPGLLSNADVIILAIKPQDFSTALKELKESKKLGNKLMVSIAAGITTAIIEEFLGPVEVKVIRVMPNLFVASGNGVCGICKGRYATEDNLLSIKGLLECLGQVIQVNEDKMDAVTAVSGSGPGYLCHLVKDDVSSERIEHLREIIPLYEKAASKLGFSPDEVKIVATGTAASVVQYLESHTEDEAPRVFCDKVTSEGGTTGAAISVLKNKGEKALIEAIEAAEEKAKEIAAKIESEIRKREK